MKHINNFFVKLGYGICVAFYVIAFIALHIIDGLGFRVLFLYFVSLPLTAPAFETTAEIGGFILKYAYGVSAYLIFVPKWFEHKNMEGEALTLFEIIFVSVNKWGNDLDLWYNAHIKR